MSHPGGVGVDRAATHPAARRGAAIAAVVAALAAVLALLSTIIANPLASLISILALASLVMSAWVALTNRGRKRRLALVLAVAALVLLVVTLVRDEEHGYLLLVSFVLLAIGVPAGRFALGREPAPLPSDEDVPPAERPALVVNPKSGDGRAESLGLSEEARRRGIRVYEFDGTRSILDLVAQAVQDGADAVGVAGGDGSLTMAARVVSDAGRDFVCIPAGTRNHFALDLGLDRTDPLAGLAAFGPAHRRVIDLGEVNGRPFLNNVSLGLYGEIVQSDDYRGDKVGTTLARLPDIVTDTPQALDLLFTDDQGVVRDDAQVVHVSNNPYIVSVVGLGGRPTLRSGELGIICLRIDGGLRAAEVIARSILGGSGDAMRSWSAPDFRVDSAAPVAAGIDGEAVTLDPPLLFRSIPGAVPVRLPPAAPMEGPAAGNHGYRWTAEELLRRAFRPQSEWRRMPVTVDR